MTDLRLSKKVTLLAEQGLSIAAIVDALLRDLALAEPKMARLRIIQVFRDAFGIPLHHAVAIGALPVFGDGMMSDESVETLIRPYIDQRQSG